MRQMGQGSQIYSEHSRQFIPGLSWKGGVTQETTYSDLRSAGDDKESVRHQALQLVRERSGVQGASSDNSWYPNIWFSHLVFLDYLSGVGEEPTAVCPEDVEQFGRFETPIADFSLSQLRRKYESSYEMAIFAHCNDTIVGDVYPVNQHTSPWNSFNRSPNFLQNRRWTEVVFPSSKVFMFDTFVRHDGDATDKLFFEPGTSQPLLFFDGSVNRRNTDDANPGGRPKFPRNPDPTLIKISQSDSELYPGRFRWTRGGLKGVDYGGSEIDTGQGGSSP